ncbi:zinc ribbon domain-containing protein [Desulfobacterales bacterium HSG16]|nr:zinc ribbon domain-containing protein [Desulfobacterales bacterium HSG16]
MPVYEFYCNDCNTIYNFFSKTVNTTKIPVCPRCANKNLSRQVSMFSVAGKAKEDSDMDDLPIDESRMEEAMNMLARESDKLNEDDPAQAARLMRRLSDMTGLELGEGMTEALNRMEKGEDPDMIESEMGDMIESEDPFIISGKKGKAGRKKRVEPFKDDTFYDL